MLLNAVYKRDPLPLPFTFVLRKEEEASTGSMLPIPLLPLAAITAPSDVLDMPVDPNEPTYCLCHQVSYGEMIGCDNQDVSVVFKLFKAASSATLLIFSRERILIR